MTTINYSREGNNPSPIVINSIKKATASNMLYRLYKILFIFSRFTTTTIVSLFRLERVIPFILDPIFELEVIPLPVKVFHLNKHREEKKIILVSVMEHLSGIL